MIKGNKHQKNIRRIRKNRVFQLQQQEKDNFWNKYKSNFMRNCSSDKSSSDGEEDEKDNDYAYKRI